MGSISCSALEPVKVPLSVGSINPPKAVAWERVRHARGSRNIPNTDAHFQLMLRGSAEWSRSPSNRDEVGRIQSAGFVMGVPGGGSSKAPPSRDPDRAARVQARPTRGLPPPPELQRRRFMGERPSSPRPVQEGSMPECAGMQGDATGAARSPCQDCVVVQHTSCESPELIFTNRFVDGLKPCLKR